MDQSLSGGSGNPSQTTLTLICSFCESITLNASQSLDRVWIVLDEIDQ
jgi:hypothetical protein